MFNGMYWKGLYFQANNDGGTANAGAGAANNGGSASGEAGAKGGETLTFETFIAKQSDEIKALMDGHINGLKTALGSERDTRKDLEKQVRDLATKAEKGSEAEKQLTTLADQMATADRKASFYEDAHTAGVTNLKLAFVVATTDELFDKKGNVNFADLKTKYPELFGVKKVPNGNAAEGTEDEPDTAGSAMNRLIRKKAGRSS